MVKGRAPRLMGVLNLTPDSFSDGGAWSDPRAAVARAAEMVAEGASIVDVGGESTRPGASRVAAAEQKSRTLEVVAAIAREVEGALVSIDTTLAEVAEAALDAGCGMLNDISAGREDPRMLELAAARDAPICLMHMQGEPGTMQDAPRYDDVVAEVEAFLRERIDAALRRGVAEARILIDPGIGFGKTLDHNLQLLAQLERITAIGPPVLLGASRKRFIDGVCGGARPDERAAGSCAAAIIGLKAGVEVFRVHDVAAHRQALAVAGAVFDVRRASAS